MTTLNSIYDACLRGDLQFLQQNVPRNVHIDDYYIHQAASKGHVDVLEFLYLNGNNDMSGMFQYAWLNRQPATVEFLLHLGYLPTTDLNVYHPDLNGTDPRRDAACVGLLRAYLK